MTHTITVLSTKLCDGSRVYDVRLDETIIPCPTQEDAAALAQGLSHLLLTHGLEEHRIRFAAEFE